MNSKIRNVMIVAPWLVLACDVPEDPKERDLAADEQDLLAAGQDEDEDDALGDDALPDGADVQVGADGTETGLLCVLCVLAGHDEVCGDDGQTYPNKCFAKCHGAEVVPEGSYYTDADGDGFGDAGATPVQACSAPDGTVDNDDDCNDADAGVFPGNVEACDGVDSDCSDATSEDDADGDGVRVCDGDCDDANADVAPGLDEVCDGVDNDCDAATECVPVTCGDIVAENPAAPDGDYTLYVLGDPDKPWTAYCHDMAGAPRSYITLQNVGPDANFSQYAAGGAAPGTTVQTNFTRVWFDPPTLRIINGDLTFSSSTGQLQHPGGGLRVNQAFGTAGACGGPNGIANIDLTGTPWKIINGFCANGFNAQGAAVLSSDDQVADLWGNGFCGHVAPVCVYDPFHGVTYVEYVGP